MKALLAVFLLLALLLPLSITHAAGGRVEGKVTDPKGAIVVGATVTLTDSLTNQAFTAVTDKQGAYKFEGLPAGAYSLVVSATGFAMRATTSRLKKALRLRWM
jgi:protocatechuate 3,4-dioxygenase beta subunit